MKQHLHENQLEIVVVFQSFRIKDQFGQRDSQKNTYAKFDLSDFNDT